jgi:hypothetical protein
MYAKTLPGESGMTINEDYAFEHLRQKRIDAMTDDEFIKLMDIPRPQLDDDLDDLDDEALKELEEVK